MSTTVISRSCPVCTGRKVQVLHRQRFTLPENHPLPREYDVVTCATCGFAYADTAGTAADYDRYYADYSKYVDQGTSTGGGGSAGDQARLEDTATAIARHLPNREACIVDIGCANGGLLGALKTNGFTRLFGIDPAVACVENTRRIFGVDADQGWLLRLPERTPRADLVIVSHVLEHVLDLREALIHVTAVLAPNGLVYAEVPDAQRYVDFLAAPFQDFNTEHINHFDAAGLENLFAASGFEPVEIGTKTIEAAAGVGYPALFGFFRHQAPAKSGTRPWRKSPAFLENLRGYITQSRAELQRVEARLSPLLNSPVIVWGTGQLTLKLLAETNLGQATIAAFVDGNPINHGKKLRGVEILAPEALRQLPPLPIIIGSMLHDKAIAQRIRGPLALSNPIVRLGRDA